MVTKYSREDNGSEENPALGQRDTLTPSYTKKTPNDLGFAVGVTGPSHTNTHACTLYLFQAPLTIDGAAVCISADLRIRWCVAKGLAAIGSVWHRCRNFHYNDVGCGVTGMHPQHGGEEHTQGDRKASPEQEGAAKGVVGGGSWRIHAHLQSVPWSIQGILRNTNGEMLSMSLYIYKWTLQPGTSSRTQIFKEIWICVVAG